MNGVKECFPLLFPLHQREGVHHYAEIGIISVPTNEAGKVISFLCKSCCIMFSNGPCCKGPCTPATVYKLTLCWNPKTQINVHPVTSHCFHHTYRQNTCHHSYLRSDILYSHGLNLFNNNIFMSFFFFLMHSSKTQVASALSFNFSHLKALLTLMSTVKSYISPTFKLPWNTVNTVTSAQNKFLS